MSEKTKHQIEPVVAFGEGAICRVLGGIDRKTLHRYFKEFPDLERICAKNRRGKRMAVIDDLKAWVREQGAPEEG